MDVPKKETSRLKKAAKIGLIHFMCVHNHSYYSAFTDLSIKKSCLFFPPADQMQMKVKNFLAPTLFNIKQ